MKSCVVGVGRILIKNIINNLLEVLLYVFDLEDMS